MSVTMLQKRGTRAAIDAAAASSQLVAGQIYQITDEGNLAMATSASTYETYVKAIGFKSIEVLTLAAYNALSPPDADRLYAIVG